MMRDELDRALICIPIVAKDDDEIISQAKKIVEKNKSARIDIAEFRADYYSGLNNYGMLENLLSRIHIILNNAGIRFLFTIRSHEEGGEKLSFTSPTVNEINLYVDNVRKWLYTLLKYKIYGDYVMDVSAKIKELRKKTGLSQSKFSAKFGIPVRTLQQWEQGISAPPEYLVRMMTYIMLLEERFENTDS